MTAERTALYRMFDTESTLLYIGIARRIGARWDQHAICQPWWPDVHLLNAEWYPSREEAESAERAAIRTEKPKYNVAHNPEFRRAATSSRYPAGAWIRREEVRHQRLSEIKEHTDPRDGLINKLLACIPLTHPHHDMAWGFVHEAIDELSEVGEVMTAAVPRRDTSGSRSG